MKEDRAPKLLQVQEPPLEELPTFVELAQAQLRYAVPAEKTINIKVAINTARMMVESEQRKRTIGFELYEALTDALAELDTYWKGDYIGRELPMKIRAALARAEGKYSCCTSRRS